MKSISNQIGVLFIGTILFICGGLGFLSYNYAANAVLSEVEQSLEFMAGEATKYVESRIETQLAILDALSARREIQSMDWNTQQPVLKAELNRGSNFLLWQ